MVISDYSLYWSQPFHFGTVLSKSVQTSKTTTWIWNLHAIPHDFSIQGLSIISINGFSSDRRKKGNLSKYKPHILALLIHGRITL
jgi:hypothetical protein